MLETFDTMPDLPTPLLIGLLIFLVILCAFFAGSETAMMALNRFKLKHRVKQKEKKALLVHQLLNPPDKLLSLVLMGNTFANIAASSVATLLIMRWMDLKIAILIANFMLAFVMFIFGEMIPKTLSAIHPEYIAFRAARLLWFLDKALYPILKITQLIHTTFLKIFAIPRTREAQDTLDPEELKTLIYEGRLHLSKRNKAMLLQILDLKNVNVEDIMIPRSDIVGINLSASWEEILEQLTHAEHSRLPLYESNIHEIKGVVHMRDLVPSLAKGELSVERLTQAATVPYFVPEGTPLTKQLLYFQKNSTRMGFVVDEYGTLQGLITLEDILEEVVGDFTNDISAPGTLENAALGTYLVEGSASLRWLNRTYGWDLPTSGPKTLNGLILEYLEEIPSTEVKLNLQGYRMEILDVEDHVIQMVRVHAPPKVQSK